MLKNFLSACVLASVVVYLSGCGNDCPTGTTNPSCSNYNPYVTQPYPGQPYQNPYPGQYQNPVPGQYPTNYPTQPVPGNFPQQPPVGYYGPVNYGPGGFPPGGMNPYGPQNPYVYPCDPANPYCYYQR